MTQILHKQPVFEGQISSKKKAEKSRKHLLQRDVVTKVEKKILASKTCTEHAHNFLKTCSLHSMPQGGNSTRGLRRNSNLMKNMLTRLFKGLSPRNNVGKLAPSRDSSSAARKRPGRGRGVLLYAGTLYTNHF